MNAVTSHEKPGNPPSPGTVAEWLAALSRLVSPSFPADAAEAFAAFKPLLVELPPAAFNRDTLDDAARCARSPNRVPTYAEVRQVLDAWLTAERDRRALPSPGALDAEAQSWVAFYQRRKSEGFPPQQTHHRTTRQVRDNLLSLIRAQSMPAYRHLMETGQ